MNEIPIIKQNVENFKQELKDIGAEKPKLIAFGNVVHDILINNLADEFEIFSISHYSHFMNKEFVFQHTHCFDSRDGLSGDVAILSKTGEFTLLTEDDITLKK